MRRGGRRFPASEGVRRASRAGAATAHGLPAAGDFHGPRRPGTSESGAGSRSRPRAAGAALGLTLLSVAVLSSCNRGDDRPLPLVLLVTIDTLRADRLSSYGGRVPTPAIDGLAESGIRFDRAYAPSPLTGPSHASLFTGLLPPEHGVRDNGVPLERSVPTLAEAFRDEGYETAAFVGAAPLDERLGFSRGFTTFDGRFRTRPGSNLFAERRAREVTALASTFVRERTDPGRPLFLWIHLFDPHAPYEPPAPFDRFPDPYDGEIAYVDFVLGEFLSFLRLAGLLGPRSLVVVVSDHGESLGEHGEATHGLLLHDATLRVPLVLSGAGLARSVETAPVSLVDAAPTILALARLAPLGGARGVPVAGRGAAPPDSSRPLYAESYFAYFRYRWAGLRSIRVAPLKWIDGGPEKRLFDVAADPPETLDLSRARPDDAERLARRLAAAERSFAPPPVAADGGAVIGPPPAIEALGYLASPPRAREARDLPPPGNDRLPGVESRLPLLERLDRARSLLSAGRPVEARDLARAVAAEDPGNPDAALTLGRAERDLGKAGDPGAYERAADALLSAIAARPLDPKPRNALVQVRFLSGSDAAALAAADEAEAARAADADTAALAGEILSRPGSPVFDAAEADRRFRLAIERDPDHPVQNERLRRR